MSGTRAYVFCAFSIRKETAVLSSEEVERQVYYKGRKPALEILGEIWSYN